MPTPRRVRANAFDVTRTDRDEAEAAPPLSAVLPRMSQAAPMPALVGAARGGLAESEAGPGPQARLGAPGSGPGRPRGAGGRAGLATSGITATAARVPVELYERAEPLVKGPGKPSWGQLVAWTCQTAPAAVVEAVLAQLRPAEGLIPRGQNKRARGSTQITARFTVEEHATFTNVLEQARAATIDADLPGAATATNVVIAALQVAAP